MFLVAYGKKSLGEIFNKNMAYGQKSIIESSEFRLQTSDLRLQTSFLRYSYSITVFAKRSCGVLSHDFLAGCYPTEKARIELDDAIAMTDKNLGGTLASLATATVDGDGLAEGKG